MGITVYFVADPLFNMLEKYNWYSMHSIGTFPWIVAHLMSLEGTLFLVDSRTTGFNLLLRSPPFSGNCAVSFSFFFYSVFMPSSMCWWWPLNYYLLDYYYLDCNIASESHWVLNDATWQVSVLCSNVPVGGRMWWVERFSLYAAQNYYSVQSFSSLLQEINTVVNS